MLFGQLLRQLRGDVSRDVFLSWAQKAPDVQDVAGLVPSALTHWESSRRIPTPPQLRAMILGCHAEGDVDRVARLVRAAAAHEVGHQYRSFLQATRGTEIQEATESPARTTAFLAWAKAIPSQPPRADRDVYSPRLFRTREDDSPTAPDDVEIDCEVDPDGVEPGEVEPVAAMANLDECAGVEAG